jgi:hypothetical protein
MLKSSRGRLKEVAVLVPIRMVLVILAAVALAAAPAAQVEARLPSAGSAFAAGERLVYRVEWNPPWYLFFLPPMEAGEATLSLSEETSEPAQKSLKIVFTARSSGTLVKLTGMSIDDRFEFTSDPGTFCTRSVRKQVREGKRARDINYSYLPESGKLHLREVNVATQPNQVLRDQDYEGIPPCVKDLFSALYSLRRNQLETGSSTRVLVGDDNVVKEVEVRVGKKEKVSTPAGSFDTWQVDTISVIGGLFKGSGQFQMWLSADDRKMPVKFEAKIYIGKVTGQLKDMKF